MGGMYVDPSSNPDAFDGVIFNDTLKTPGKVKVTGWDRPVEYDHKQGKGTKGAEQTLKGLPPAKGSIEWETWTEDQRRAWNQILDALRFDPTKLATGTTAASTASSTSSGPGASFTGGSGGSGGSGQTAGIPSPQAGANSFTGGTTAASSTSTPSPLSSAFAIAIYYPTLADIDVHFVLPPEKLGIWEPVGDDYSHMKRKIDFVEYTGTPPNKSIASTPTGPASPADATASPGSAFNSGTPGEGSAANNAATNQGTAASGAQGAWGAP